MQSIASLMSIGKATDIGNMGDVEEEEEYDADSAAADDETASRISEMTSQFNTSVTEEDGSAQAAGMMATNGPIADHSESQSDRIVHSHKLILDFRAQARSWDAVCRPVRENRNLEIFSIVFLFSFRWLIREDAYKITVNAQSQHQPV